MFLDHPKTNDNVPDGYVGYYYYSSGICWKGSVQGFEIEVHEIRFIALVM